jgi:hypothetical protein
MHKLLELCKPGLDEVFLYLFMAFCLLFIGNMPGLWYFLLSSSHTDPETAQLLGVNLRNMITSHTSLSDPQIVNAFIWGMTAALGLVLAVGITDFFRAEAEDKLMIHQRGGAVSFVSRLALRLAALLGLVAYGVLFVLVLLPGLLRLFLAAVTHPLVNSTNLPLALVSLLATAASIYLFAIMIRLLLLRVRVFETFIEN